MYQILISDSGDYMIPISLTSNTRIEGTYIDAETAKATQNIRTSRVDRFNLAGNNVSAAALNTTPVTTVRNNLRREIANTNRFTVEKLVVTNQLTVEKRAMNSNDLKNYFNTNEYFVTGTTDSKFETIFKSFTNLPVSSPVTETYGVNSILPTKPVSNSEIIGKKILINGTDIYAMVLRNDTIKEYVLYVDTEYPIKYIDFSDGTTNFKYKAAPDYKIMDGKILYYNGLVDEPKILSEVFIDRGVNNVFEPVKRLKNIDNLKELMKVGLGYYKINSTGFNFKNAK